MDEAKARGNEKLLPFGLKVEDVQLVKLSRKKYSNAATAKQFVKLHGFGTPQMTTTRDHFIFEVAKSDAFDGDTLRTERINHDFVVQAGARNLTEEDLEFDIDVEEPAATDAPEIEAAPVAKVGDLFAIRKQDDDSETDSVRTVGIVLKPEEADSQGSLISEEEIESANLDFMKDFGTVGLMHQKSVEGRVFIIQNVIAPTDILFQQSDGTTKTVTKGTWYQEHYTEDAEIVDKIRKGEITGLSIGGFAKHVPIDKASHQEAVQKNADGLEPVQKGEADHRLVDLSVQEVSMVDVAANEERFLVIKRLDPNAAAEPANAEEAEMSKPEVKDAAAPAEGADQTQPDQAAPEAQPEATPEPVAKTEPAAPASAPEAQPETEPAPPAVDDLVAEAVTKAVAAALAPLQTALDAVTKKVDEQAVEVQKSAAVVASAKGDSTPEVTEVQKNDEQQKSVWAGSVVHRIAQRAK